VEELQEADLIVVGGGNTFQLLRECRMRGFLSVIQEKLRSGACYLGWSAGANLSCPTIKTTNDMPIVDPRARRSSCAGRTARPGSRARSRLCASPRE
jgi:dipeptidase E